MYEYSLYQWMIFFFFYCLVGWVWESCYVSAKKRKWVNRGFLHGPFLPIYGFGAISVLWITLPVRQNSWAVVIAGAVGATVLEYITGAVMERLFHVRYWDYSNQRCNLNGYICLTSTIAWGIFSVILVQYVHHYVETVIARMPDTWLVVLDIMLAALMFVDTVTSAREAFDLKEIILAEKEKELALMAQSLSLVKQNIEESSARIREGFGESTERLRGSIDGSAERIRETIGEVKESLEEGTGRIREGVLERRLESREKLLLLQSELEQRMAVLQRSSERRLRSAGRILKRNPTSTYQQKRITLEGLKEKLEKWNSR